MNILTSKAKTARKDYLGSNCKLFFPFNEGAGTAFTNLVTGESFTDSGAIHTTVHTITLGGLNLVPATPVPNLKGKNIILIHSVVVTTGHTFPGLAIGNSATGFQISTNGQYVRVNSDAGSQVQADTGLVFADVGKKAFIAGTYNKDTAELRSYLGLDSGDVAFSATADASVHASASATANVININNNGIDQPTYASALILPNTLPAEADLLTYLNWTFNQVKRGHKVIHPDFANY